MPKLLEEAKKAGYVRVRVDGSLYELSEEIELDKNIKHTHRGRQWTVWLSKPGIETRLTDSVETALKLSDGLVCWRSSAAESSDSFSQNLCLPGLRHQASRSCSPRLFSFNNPFGACPELYRPGRDAVKVDADLLIPNPEAVLESGRNCGARLGFGRQQ